jgi:hypothetical protein
MMSALGIPIQFILPAFMLLRLAKTRGGATIPMKATCYFLFLFGGVASVGGVVSSILNWTA